MFRPVMDSTLVGVLLWAFNVLCFGTIVKRLRWHMSNVPKSVPLRTTLRVQIIFIIICHSYVTERLDFVLEDFPAECWNIGHIEREIEWNDLPRLDFLRSSRNTGWSEEIEASYL